MTIGSDHSPCPPELKRLESGDFGSAWGGIASLQLSLSASHTMIDEVFEIERLMSHAPAYMVNLRATKGAIEPGLDADLVIFDPNQSFTVRGQDLFHRHKLTPYEGHTLKGKVKATYLRGQKIYDGQNIIGPPTGQILLRKS
jgi:allantoinase